MSYTLHFRAVGSKNTIKEIGLLAASGKITQVFSRQWTET